MNRIVLALILVFSLFKLNYADEGMWIPLYLEKYNIEDMKAKGFKLTAEDVYNINHTSLKDAVVLFGRGCTGELISDKGLLLTNHHCGYSAIQNHSSVENDYLTEGFWAMTEAEELPNPGLEARILIKMEDVTDLVFKDIKEEFTDEERLTMIKENSERIVKKASKVSKNEILIKAFFSGNQYFLIEYEVFKDVRLVGAPPSSIGKFGGDTDNWMWPRHTGDFSIFRIYVDSDNKPAEYNENNIPYTPKYSFPISLKGIKKGDFTMVYGFPGRTSEYLTSFAVRLITETENPHQIKLREKRLEIMQKEMDISKETRIKYASKYARVANYWKKWIGENKGLQRLNAIQIKERNEKEFANWIGSEPQLNIQYGSLLSDLDSLYTEIKPYRLAVDYFYEAIYSIEIIKFASRFNVLEKYANENLKNNELQEKVLSLQNALNSFYKNYNKIIDKNCFAFLLNQYFINIDPQFHPKRLKNLIYGKYKGDYTAFINDAFKKSIFTDSTKLMLFLNGYTNNKLKKILRDPIYMIYKDFSIISQTSILPRYYILSDKIANLNRVYMNLMQKMNSDKILYPDANFTLRVAYGKVDDYSPGDAIYYNYYTTLSGIMEKDNPEVYDYNVPLKLKQLYARKDYGRYSSDSTMHVCFTASNHTTGGNSGSPVLDENGYLIGVNFDRNWEGTMSDIMYDPDQCRNIVLDIRYALFIIDKFAGASHLIDEMKLID